MRLHRRVILVTRPRDQAGPLCRRIEEQGGQALRLPAVVIQAVAVSAHRLRECLAPPPALVIFTSRNAVRHGPLQALAGLRPLPGLLAAGPGTAQALRDQGLAPGAPPPAQAGSEALLALPALAAAAVRGERIVVVKGQGGSPVLQETLQGRGALLELLEVYRRILPGIPGAEIQALLAEGRPDTVVVTSCDGLRNLCRLVPAGERERFKALSLAALTPGVAQLAETLDFTGAIRTAPEASDDGLLQALAALAPG